ncbi:hypothetical protein IPN35_03645 [Candidatus Peregrinibacteria bacterium]|nr:MAG: hypothetical protein IPN35_03645 [Candidatus Peregrinibacteria bacterium]
MFSGLPATENLHLFRNSIEFLEKLESFDIVQFGHFEYKGKAMDGSRLHGEIFVDFRRLTTGQELEISEYYRAAIMEWFSEKENLLIAGVAMGSLALPKLIQLSLYADMGAEYIYTEKRDGALGIYDQQAEKCRGKHILFIEDACNNGASSRELIREITEKKEVLGITGFSILYGVHRGHTFFHEPKGEFYAMSSLYAPAYHASECPACEKGIPLKQYKK